MKEKEKLGIYIHIPFCKSKCGYCDFCSNPPASAQEIERYQNALMLHMQDLSAAAEKFERAGFEIVDGQECFRPIRFFDVGALVWFARIIQWEFPGFSVERCADALLTAQRILEQNGSVDGRIHRFLLTARKK